MECGPAEKSTGGPTMLQDESFTVRQEIIRVLPNISLHLTVFHPVWAVRDEIKYKHYNCFLIHSTDGLDPKFVKLNELLVLNAIYCKSVRLNLYFDDHYFHSYIIEVTAN